MTERCQGTVPSILHFLPSNHDGHRFSRFFFTVRSASSLNSPLHSLTHYNIIMMMIEGECWLRSRIGIVHFRSAPRSIPNRRHTHNKTATRHDGHGKDVVDYAIAHGWLGWGSSSWMASGGGVSGEGDQVSMNDQNMWIGLTKKQEQVFPLIHHQRQSPRTSFRFLFCIWQLC